MKEDPKDRGCLLLSPYITQPFIDLVLQPA